MKRIITITDEFGIDTIRVRKMFFALLILVSCASGLEAHTGANCAAVTTKGLPCKLTASNGSKFCPVHNPLNQCAGITSKNAKCKKQHINGSKFCEMHQAQAK